MSDHFHNSMRDSLPTLDEWGNIDRIKELSKKINVIDIINPTSRQIGILAEIINRIKKIT